jgi:1-acyl-sn-glycerol-3-phosphate acyltransferase
MAYIASMCVALPMVLFPVWLCNKSQLIDKRTGEQWALDVGQFCARWLLYIMPFVNMKVHSDAVDESNPPEPSIWVCNHTSMLDTFIFLASDLQLRGSNKHPIKAIYVSSSSSALLSEIFLLA